MNLYQVVLHRPKDADGENSRPNLTMHSCIVSNDVGEQYDRD